MKLLLQLLLVVVTTSTVVAHTTVNIHMPFQLYNQDGYHHRTGRFGHSGMAMTHLAGSTEYGSMHLQAYKAPNDLCSHYFPPANTTAPHYNPPFLFITHRDDNCTFVSKTRRAQHMGAAGLLIMDSHCVCSDGDDCYNPHNEIPCQHESPTVADDGSGGDVSIPALLLKKQDGQAIYETLGNQTTVLVSLTWTPPTPNTTAKPNATDKLDYGMILDIMDPHTADLHAQMEPVALAVGKEATFWPSYLIYNGTEHCGRQVCTSTCTHRGKYCYPHPKGVEVMKEILRRLCIWKHHGDTADDKKTGTEGEAFWKYVSYFDQHCATNYWKLDTDTKKNTACIDKALKHANVKSDDVGVCFRDTGDPDGEGPSTILEPLLRQISEYGVTRAPQIWVDHVTLPHYWSAPGAANLLQAMCNGFQTKLAPEACKKCLGNSKKSSDKDIMACAKQHYHDTIKHPHRHIWRTAILLGFILVGGGVGYIVWRRRQDGMDLNRDGLFNPLQGYLPLNPGSSNDQGDANGIVPEQQQTIDFQ